MSERKVGVSEKMRALAVGDVLPGVVTSIQDYGAFIRLADLPEAFGLVHITELSWEKVMMVDDVVSVGEWIQSQGQGWMGQDGKQSLHRLSDAHLSGRERI